MSSLFGLVGGDYGVRQTLSTMRGAVNFALREPGQRVRRRAEQLLGGVQEYDKDAEVEKMFTWTKNHFHFLLDPRGLEYTKSPEVSDAEISKVGSFSGDCDDVTTYLAALLASVGYAVKFVVTSPSNQPSMDFKHVYLRVYLPTSNRWIALDACAKGKPYGWEVPSKRREEVAVN